MTLNDTKLIPLSYVGSSVECEFKCWLIFTGKMAIVSSVFLNSFTLSMGLLFR